MLYGIEINEPYQANAEFKFRCLMSLEHDSPAWTPHLGVDEEPNPRAFATPSEDVAKQLVSLLPASFDAQVVPVEVGTEVDSDAALVQSFGARARLARQQTREIQ